eukprot:UN03912
MKNDQRLLENKKKHTKEFICVLLMCLCVRLFDCL